MLSLPSFRKKLQEFRNKARDFQVLAEAMRNGEPEPVEVVHATRTELRVRYGELQPYLSALYAGPASQLLKTSLTDYEQALKTVFFGGPTFEDLYSSLGSVVQHLDLVRGRVKHLTQSEFDKLVNPRGTDQPKDSKPKKKTEHATWLHWTNPVWLIGCILSLALEALLATAMFIKALAASFWRNLTKMPSLIDPKGLVTNLTVKAITFGIVALLAYLGYDQYIPGMKPAAPTQQEAAKDLKS